MRAVGSRAVSSLVMLRLRRMPPAAIEAARAVALIGQDADLPAIAALAQLPEEGALRTWWGSGVLIRGGVSVR